MFQSIIHSSATARPSRVLEPARRRREGVGLVGNGLGFAAGVIAIYTQPVLPNALALISIVLVLIAIGLLLPAMRPAAFLGGGLAWAFVWACSAICDPFPAAHTRADLELVGVVESVPVANDFATRFLFRVEAARRAGVDVGFDGRVRLSWYRQVPSLEPGQRWRLTARLKPPHGFANPGGFDYERWLFTQGVDATGYVRAKEPTELIATQRWLYWVDRMRQLVGDHIDGLLRDRAAGLVRALVIGDRSGLGDAEWEVLTRTGTNHLIAISGLHVGMVATFAFFLIRWLVTRSVRLCLQVSAPRVAALGAFATAFLYSGLAGFAISTQRALIMIAVVLGALIAGRTMRPASALALALIGVLLVDPRAVLSFGFWLSFGAVAALIYAFAFRLPDKGLWNRWGRAQVVVAIGLLPVLLYLFGRMSWIAPVINLVAVPVFSLALLPALLVSLVISLVAGFDQPLLFVAAFLAGAFDLLARAAEWDLAAMTMAARPTWVWIASIGGVLLLLAPRAVPGRWLGWVLMMPLVTVRPPALPSGTADFTLLDVGQGLAAVVRTRGHVLVFDTGPNFPSGFNTGSAVVLPYLRHEGIERIDMLVLSHADNDHAGGYVGLAGRIPIGRVLSGEPDEIDTDRAGLCRAGESWRWDGVWFSFLHPERSTEDGNNSSCVLRVDTEGASLLITGDIEAPIEARLVGSAPSALSADILVAGHHGSATSSTRAFLEAVSPRVVLYSAGFANRYGFPAEVVRERVDALGIDAHNTAETGAMRFTLDDTGFEGPQQYRLTHTRLWTHRVAD